MRYRPEVDGLRALAVLPVVFFHAGMPGFSGGFVGVDVFFVISGYLITTILLREIEAGDFSIARFYERRARRIVPALVCVMVVVALAGCALLVPDQLQTLGSSMLAVTLFASNFFFWQTTDYFKPAAELQPLLHTWSLAVEEQFYILYPFVLLLCWRHCRQHLKLVLALLLVSSLVLAEVGWRTKPIANFYLLLPRAWELLAGALVALVPHETWLRRLGRRSAGAAATLGVGLILAAVVLFDKGWPAPSLYTTLPVAGAVLVIVGTVHVNPVARILALRPLVFIGLISYSAYLWHQPLFSFYRILHFSDEGHAVPWYLVLAVFLLAALTWRFVERPFRASSPVRFSAARIGALTSASLVSLGCLGLWMHLGQGWTSRVAASYKPAAWDSYQAANYGLDPACEYTTGFAPQAACTSGAQPQVLLWGDSYAMHLAQGLKASGLAFTQATKSNCGPSIGVAPLPERGAYFQSWAAECLGFNDSVLDHLRHAPQVRYVLLASAFDQYLMGKHYSAQQGGYTPTKQERDAAFDKTIQDIKALGKVPVLVVPPPRFGLDVGACLRRAATGLPTPSQAVAAACSFAPSAITPESREVGALVRALARRHDIGLVDYEAAICRAGQCETSLNGVPVYRDHGHLSAAGSAALAQARGLYARFASTQ